MNKQLIKILLVLGLTSVATSGWAQFFKSSDSESGTYATVGDGVISKNIYEQAMKEALRSGRQDSPQLRNEVRNILINQELLVQEALKQGLDKNPDHSRAIQNLRRNYYVQLMLQNQLQKNPVTNEQIQREYEQRFSAQSIANKLDYKITSWIFPSVNEAEAMIELLSKGESIAKAEKKLAIKKEQRQNKGSWVAQTNIVKPVLDVIGTLSKGGHSLKPVQIGNAMHVILLEDKRPMTAPKLEEVKVILTNDLVNKRQEEYLSTLRNKTKININP